MNIASLRVDLIGPVRDLLSMGEPYISPRGVSDYWLYASLFGDTCLVAIENEQVIGAALGFQSQVDPTDLYLQDVMVHPEHRGRGIAKDLITAVAETGRKRGCTRMYLTSEPENSVAHQTWLGLGFVNVPGDYTEHGVHVTADYKGPGRDRAVYEIHLR
ncbi:GNAT family N-acetyltransferase [Glycomyces sp. MUSA5-2]|uniref:GNAT family N-acetyltransferase n=1 Tax=Glycomyces sp. MUSA5-2 TaxID=2053002 RepID=UPI00300852E1